MVDTIMSGEIVLDVYKQMLELQSSNHNNAISLIVALFGFGFLFSFWWNWKGAKKYIQDQIQKQFEVEKDELIKKCHDKIGGDIETEFEKYQDKLKRVEADVYRSIAISASKANNHAASIRWYSGALEIWVDLGEQKMIRLIVDLMKTEVEKSGANEENKIEIHDKTGVLEKVSKIPDILDDEKKYIYSQISKFFTDIED